MSKPTTTTTTPAKVAKAPAKRTLKSGIARIIASAAIVAKSATVLAEDLVGIGFHVEAGQRAETALWEDMAKFRRFFPAAPEVRNLLGEDAPDLYGQTPEYKAAWGKVLDDARTALAARYVEEWGMNPIAAEKQAKDHVEKYRKANSVRYRNSLEASVRAEISNPVERCWFMLAHGFNYQSNVSGDMCIPVKGAHLKDGAVVIPGHVVDAKAGTIKAIKSTTPANQQGQGAENTVKTAAAALATQFADHAARHDFVGLLGDAQSILATILSTTIPNEVDQATRARALVELERMLVKVTTHAKVTPAQYRAARTHKPAAPAAPAQSEEAKAEEFARKLEEEAANA